MSQTYELACRSCHETIWIGQGHDPTLYFYFDEAGLRGDLPHQNGESPLNGFLRRHLSHDTDTPEHELVLYETQNVPPEWNEVDWQGPE
jgi:hypothetical protein